MIFEQGFKGIQAFIFDINGGKEEGRRRKKKEERERRLQREKKNGIQNL